MEDEMSKHIVSTVPADGLAPLGARTSTGTVVTRWKRARYVIDDIMAVADQVIEWWIVCFSVHSALSSVVDFLETCTSTNNLTLLVRDRLIICFISAYDQYFLLNHTKQ